MTLGTQDRGIVTAEEKLAYLVGKLKDATTRLEEWIGSDCECDNTHEAVGTKCCLCTYKAAIHRVTEPRLVMFMQQTVTTPDGEYIPCIAVEGERGYHKTDWKWGRDFDAAEKMCEERNTEQGIGRIEAMRIIAGTMRAKGGSSRVRVGG